MSFEKKEMFFLFLGVWTERLLPCNILSQSWSGIFIKSHDNFNLVWMYNTIVIIYRGS